MAGRRAGAKHVATWLVDHDLAHVTDSTMEDLSPHDRVVMLTSLAAMRDARFLVVTLPERHGGLPDLWLPHLESLAGEGLGVLVTTSNGLTAHIPHAIRTVSFGDAQEDLG
ncbi:MAG: hypothetical protein JWO46_2284, partial [Nocardioidaceae bacterium]|nr:hypothetical protein [Nocardioidaceae bacterium]